MDTGRWIMVGLIAAGVVLIIVSILPVLRRMRGIRARLEELQQSRLMRSVDGLQREGERFAMLSKRAQPVIQRAQAAVGQVQTSVTEFKELPARDALADAGGEMSALLEDLR